MCSGKKRLSNKEKAPVRYRTGARKTVSPPYGCNHTEDFLRILSNLLAANGLSKPFGRGKSTGG